MKFLRPEWKEDPKEDKEMMMGTIKVAPPTLAFQFSRENARRVRVHTRPNEPTNEHAHNSRHSNAKTESPSELTVSIYINISEGKKTTHKLEIRSIINSYKRINAKHHTLVDTLLPFHLASTPISAVDIINKN